MPTGSTAFQCHMLLPGEHDGFYAGVSVTVARCRWRPAPRPFASLARRRVYRPGRCRDCVCIHKIFIKYNVINIIFVITTVAILYNATDIEIIEKTQYKTTFIIQN